MGMASVLSVDAHVTDELTERVLRVEMQRVAGLDAPQPRNFASSSSVGRAEGGAAMKVSSATSSVNQSKIRFTSAGPGERRRTSLPSRSVTSLL